MKNVNDNKGITLIALIVTILVLLIIAGITISGTITGIDEADDNRLVTELGKVQHAITERYTKYELLKDSSLLVGTKVDTSSLTGVPDSISWKVFQATTASETTTHPERKYYRLSKTDLDNLGLTGDFKGSSYIVNYYSGEVYDEGQIQTSEGKILYKTAIENEASELGDDIIKEDLLVYYDAINNTGTGHSSNTTVWRDLSGNGRNGKMTDVTMGSNYAEFNETSSWVNMGEINDFTNQITMEAVIELTSIQTGEREIIDNFEAGGLGLRLKDGKPTFMLNLQGLNYVECVSNEILSANKKYHIIGIYDGRNINIYINGVKQNNLTMKKWNSDETVTINNETNIKKTQNNTVMAIGANPTGTSIDTSFKYKGIIYNVQIYNKALSASEIKHNYILDKNRYGIE